MKAASEPIIYDDIIDMDDDSIDDAYLYSAEKYRKYAKLTYLNAQMDTDFDTIEAVEHYAAKHFPELLL